MNTSIFSFWAKTGTSTPETASTKFHPLIYHLLDVAACAEALLRQERPRVERLAKSCNVNADHLTSCFVALIALHDIGKCASGFQGKALDFWPEFLGPKPREELNVRHDAAGVWMFTENGKLAEIAQRLLPNLSASKRMTIIQAVCGHHGEPINWHDYPDIRNHRRQIGTKAQEAADAIADSIFEFFQPPACLLEDQHAALASFWLAGLAVLSDWLGSNRVWFEFQRTPRSGGLLENIVSYCEMHARPCAARAMVEAGLISARASSQTGLAHLFGAGYTATPLQKYAENVDLPEGPLLFIIEDMTGAGKTEAAIILAHRLMLTGKAQGLCIALPTMATANAMFVRLAASYRRLFDETSAPSIVLTHGRRDLFADFASLPNVLGKYDGDARDGEDPSQIEASAFCADWIARSNKQAFLAQVGAGTIDQAILAVLPARHQTLRLWGLLDKVLVIDEAHAYDAYMSKEIECLLQFHAALGGSAIVLSATLPQEKRASLAHAFLLGAKQGDKSIWKSSSSAYPLATSVVTEKITENPLSLRDDLAREVAVRRVGTLDEAHRCALEAAEQGAAVTLIRNTVDEAIASYEAISQYFQKVVLFHARFAMGDRQRIETEVLGRFGKESRVGRNAILVATQVVEQSLDLDFDLIISDLAPVDLLIQRAGRLWRHKRERPIAGPLFLVLSPEPSDDVGRMWPAPLLPKTAFVYDDAALLWRSAKAIFTAGKIVSRTSQTRPTVQTGEVRALIEAVYGDDIPGIPTSLEGLEITAVGRRSGERTQAGYSTLDFQKGYDWDGMKWQRDTRVKTRLAEETITLRLARMQTGRIVPWMPIEEDDLRRAWALSEVSLRRSRCSGSNNSPGVEKLVEAARHAWTLSEKDIPVVLLTPVDDVSWQGAARDGNEKPLSLQYSRSIGLKFAGKECRNFY
jgi:CRISPR-associated endonuclease/helicase Cas3